VDGQNTLTTKKTLAVVERNKSSVHSHDANTNTNSTALVPDHRHTDHDNDYNTFSGLRTSTVALLVGRLKIEKTASTRIGKGYSTVQSVSMATMDQATSAATTTLPTETETQTKSTEFVVLRVYWDEWSRCIGSRYQRDHLYRVGQLDPCSRQWKDFKTASRAKVVQWKDPATAEVMINSTFYKKRTTISPTAGAIWELKETPSWD
jgi:hypothetical protein